MLKVLKEAARKFGNHTNDSEKKLSIIENGTQRKIQ